MAHTFYPAFGLRLCPTWWCAAKAFFLILMAPLAWGQPVLIKGRVLDALSLEPLAYVSIGLTNSAQGTSSDAHGFFQLQISQPPAQDSLRF